MSSIERDLYSCFRTTLEMIEDRGFFVGEELKNTLKDNFGPYIEKYNQENGFILLFSHLEDDQNRLIVYFYKSEKAVSVDDVKRFATKLGEEKILTGIFITLKELSPSADRLVKEINSESNFYMEHFLISSLVINITHHELVPKHEIVSEDEKQTVLKKYMAKESQLPKILISDPIAKYLGARRGQLIKIMRPSETAGLHAFYRLTV